MYSEDNIEVYDGAVKVPNEIKDIKNTIIFGMTGRQLLFVSIAIGVAAFTAMILNNIFSFQTSFYLVIPIILASPFLAFGFIRPADLDLEDWFAIWRANHVKSDSVRKIFAVNAYEKVQQSGMNAENKKTDKSRKNKKEKKNKTRKQKKILKKSLYKMYC